MTTRTAALGAAPTSPPIDSEAAIPSWRKLSAAATLTEPAVVLPDVHAVFHAQLMYRLAPIYASVSVLTTLTEPLMLTATDPERPR